jgi:RHS repeat-associated protein
VPPSLAPGGADQAMPLRFPGQYHDAETGWHYNLNRHYDPTTGRYATADPLGLAPSPNHWTYPANPTTHSDPLGLQSCGNATSSTAKVGWGVGDDIHSLTKAGNSPSWSTVRSRFWKNEAANPQYGSWSDEQLARMSTGRAPQRFNPDKGGVESMELGHEPIPFRDGGTSVLPRWPQDHAAVDPFRRPGY